MNDLPTVQTWTGKKIRDYDQVAFTKQMRISLAEIVLITGGKIYDDKKESVMFNGQLKSISKLLLYSFSFLTFEEVVNAFYLNSAGRFGETHTHYGRELNVEFIGNVLASYKKFKQGIFNERGPDLVKAIKGELAPPPQKVLTDEDYLNDKRRHIEDAYQRLVKNLEIDEGLFPEYFYDVLEADGAIGKGLFEKNLEEAKNKLQKQAHVDILWKEHSEKKRNNGKEIDPQIDDGKSRYEDKVHIGKSLEKVRFLVKEGLLKRYQPAVTMSKQMLVKEFFLICLRNNEEHIYAPKKEE